MLTIEEISERQVMLIKEQKIIKNEKQRLEKLLDKVRVFNREKRAALKKLELINKTAKDMKYSKKYEVIFPSKVNIR